MKLSNRYTQCLTGGHLVLVFAFLAATAGAGLADPNLPYVPDPNLPYLHVNPTELTVYAYQGGVDPDPNLLSITNFGGGMLNWTIEITDQPDWLTISPINGSLDPNETENVTVSYTNDLPVGGLQLFL